MKNLISQGLRLDQKVSKVLRAAYETVTRRLRDDRSRNTSSARVAREWLKYAAMFVMLFTIGSGNVWGTTIASWGAISISASTSYTASGGDANNNGVASLSSTKAFNQAATNAYYGSSSGGAVITFTNLNLSGYTDVTITFYSRASKGGNFQLAYSTNGGSSWTNGNTSGTLATKNAPVSYSISFPSNSTSINAIKLTHSASSGSLYFGTITISGTAAVAKTFNLLVPNGSGGYTTRSSQSSSAMTEATATGGHSCGSGLAGYYASIWVTSAISTPTTTYPSPNYTSSNIDASSVSSGSNLYPVFTNDAGKYLTNPSCAVAKTLSSIAITSQPTTKKYLVGETFSSTGAVVTATYSDATTATVSATWTPTTGLVSGSNTITASYTEGGVTKTATTTVTAYAVTVQKQDEDGNTISAEGVSASATGRSLTASVGSTHYVFHTWKFGTASGTSISNATSATTGALTGTPSAAVTVIAEFYRPCTVTWSVNGVTSTTTVARGQTASTPADPTPSGDCAGLVFRGWTASPISGTSDSAPGDLFNTTTPSAITGDVTFYAVFAEED